MIREKIRKITLTEILVFAFILVTCIFFYKTVFFTKEKMVFPGYVPAYKVSGGDFHNWYKFGYRFFVEHKSAYYGDGENWFIHNNFPPLFTIAIFPIYLLGLTFRQGYLVHFILTLLLFLISTILFPLVFYKKKEIPPLVLFVAITGIVSYGLQFELERGNFNLVAGVLGIASVLIFHRFPRLRWVSYILFVLGAEFKIFPFIYIIFFIDNWRNIKENILRIGGLILANFLSLFVLGIHGFKGFIENVLTQTEPGAS